MDDEGVKYQDSPHAAMCRWGEPEGQDRMRLMEWSRKPILGWGDMCQKERFVFCN